MQRRSWIAGAAAAAAAMAGPAGWRQALGQGAPAAPPAQGAPAAPPMQGAPAAPRVATPAQTEGPFYPLELPPEVDADLMSVGGRAYAKGEPLLLSGRIEDLSGRPLVGARIEIWQCDADGRYHHPGDGGAADPGFQGYGRAVADADGHYRFRAMRPVAYPGRTPHIHVKVRQGGRTLLTTQIYVAGEPANARDVVLAGVRDAARREALLARLSRDRGGAWTATFPIVLDVRA